MYTNLLNRTIQFHDAWRRTKTKKLVFSYKGRVCPK